MNAGVVYLDHAATTPPDPRVLAAMQAVLSRGLGNPAALHAPGREAAAVLEEARSEVAALAGASARDVVLTSGATEANNLAIFGHAEGWASRRGGKPGHLVSIATEHKSVLGPLRRLKDRGWRITLLQPGRDGLLEAAVLEAALQSDTALVSLLQVNNETGIAQDVDALAAVCRTRGVALHVDAAQAAGKLPMPVPAADTGVDYLAFTAHKFGGPQGIGALVVSPARRAMLVPRIVGGGHEAGFRSGTPAVHLAAGFGLACRLAREEGAATAARIADLRDRLREGLADLPGARVNGHPDRRVAGILSVTFACIEGESLYSALPELAIATGSACNSASGEPSFVLRAMGHDREAAQSSLRLSLGATTTPEEIDRAIAAVRREVARLSAQSPAGAPPVADWHAAGARVVSAEAGEQRLGTWVRWHWRIGEEGAGEPPRIAEARWQAYGCPAVLEVLQRLAPRLAGRTAADGVPGAPAAWLEEVTAPVEKLGRMLIIEDATRAAFEELARPCRSR